MIELLEGMQGSNEGSLVSFPERVELIRQLVLQVKPKSCFAS